MTVRGGRVGFDPGMLYWLGNNPPYMVVRITINPNFPEELGETIDIIKKRLTEAQAKINLDINPEGMRD